MFWISGGDSMAAHFAAQISGVESNLTVALV
jgi:hypothetical protein